jgi:hypothetical protein
VLKPEISKQYAAYNVDNFNIKVYQFENVSSFKSKMSLDDCNSLDL